jgi:NAD(P)H-flavin reductase
MICGSPEMLRDLKHMLEARGFKEGNTTARRFRDRARLRRTMTAAGR